MNRRTTRNVLIVSEDAGAEIIQNMLQKYGNVISNVCRSSGKTRMEIQNIDYDAVIINPPLSDESGYDIAYEIASSTGVAVLLLIKNEYFDEISMTAENYGVFTLSKPFSVASFEHALSFMFASGERMKKLENENKKLMAKIDEMRVINQAKLLLVEKAGMRESQAHRYIEKESMDKRITKKEAAERVIKNFGS